MGFGSVFARVFHKKDYFCFGSDTSIFFGYINNNFQSRVVRARAKKCYGHYPALTLRKPENNLFFRAVSCYFVLCR